MRFCVQTWLEWEPGHRNPARARWWTGGRRCVFAPRALPRFRKWWVPPGKGHLWRPQSSLCVWTLPTRRPKEPWLTERHICTLDKTWWCLEHPLVIDYRKPSLYTKQFLLPRRQYRMCILDSILKFAMPTINEPTGSTCWYIRLSGMIVVPNINTGDK